MTIEQILLLSAVVFLSRMVFSLKGFNWSIYVVSLLAIYWFQPLSPIRTIDYWFPTIILLLAILGWLVLNKDQSILVKENRISFALLFIFFFLALISESLGIYIFNPIVSFPGRASLIFTIVLGILFYLSLESKYENNKYVFIFLLALILGIFIILKSQYLSLLASQFLRQLSGQLKSLSSADEIVWVGYSYFSFRLLHILFDRKRIKDLKLTLREYISYLIFFPAFIAGPIDRVEHFAEQLRSERKNKLSDEFIAGLFRITKGFFYKFIIADSLALISLNSHSIYQLNNSWWTWILVYSYALRLFFDFAGYTDIAIGMGRLAGIELPENFRQPYFSRNITIFWNKWHITLTQWFRTYYFNPVTRFLRTRFGALKPGTVIMITQISTMLLIGLWHGINWNFVFWGLWNGIGLFIHNRWSSLVLPKFGRFRKLFETRLGAAISVLFTFNYIALGWVWFALPTLQDSLVVFERLLGL